MFHLCSLRLIKFFAVQCDECMQVQHQYNTLVRPLFLFLFCGGGKRGLVDLHRKFCSTDSQTLGVVDRC